MFQVGAQPDAKLDPLKLHPFLASVFSFCFIWSIGGNLTENCLDSFDSFVRELFQDNTDVRVCVIPHFILTHFNHIMYSKSDTIKQVIYSLISTKESSLCCFSLVFESFNNSKRCFEGDRIKRSSSVNLN